MFRNFFSLTFLGSLLALASFRSDHPFADDRLFPFNTTVAHVFLESERNAPASDSEALTAEADTLGAMHVLMFNYCAYDSAYANKVRRILQKRMPVSVFSEFWEGSAEDLAMVLAGQEAVVIAYPFGGAPDLLKAYGKVLAQYARQGGGIVLTGTHEFGALQQIGLFDLDYGYYCMENNVRQVQPEHPVFQGVGTLFSKEVYEYPLDISDPNFTVLADVRGYPFIGTKMIGSGKVVYIGLEYYFDEPQSSRLLTNALRWAAKPRALPKRSAEVLYAGSGFAKNNTFDLKIYPNPYVSKATLDVELSKPTSLAIEMTDEMGRPVAMLLPRKNLAAGFYRLELPNVPPGVYLVQCLSSEGKEVRKVVKTAAD